MNMIESVDPKIIDKPAVRCSECDREMEHYNSFLSPQNEMRVVCWECQSREEKGFNTKRDFQRGARSGVIPR
jgi:DNA-directed RNA polymerase subunit RPC12/RpoP